VLKVIQALKEPRVIQGLKALKVIQDIQVLKEPRVIQVHKVLKVM
jgi:hypothetical protein